MRSEVDAFLAMMDSTRDPRALITLLNQARYSLQVGYDQSQKFMQFKQGINSGDIKGLDLGDFFGWYNHNFNPKALPNETPGGMQLGPVPAGMIKGTQPETAVPNPLAVPTLAPPTLRPPLGSFNR